MVSLLRPRPRAPTCRTRCTRPASAPTPRPTATRDILIELIHARGDEPLAVMGFTVRMDFEGDQWTFFKPPPEDLEELFGDRHPRDAALPAAAAADRRADRRRADDDRRARLLVSARHRGDELSQRAREDLGDRRGDRPGRRAPALLPQHQPARARRRGLPRRLPARARRSPTTSSPRTPSSSASTTARACSGEELRAAARELLRGHLERRPATNPFERFGEQLAHDLPTLLEGDVADYHDYAFATVRMFGSAFEITASHVDWLLGAEGATRVGAR